MAVAGVLNSDVAAGAGAAAVVVEAAVLPKREGVAVPTPRKEGVVVEAAGAAVGAAVVAEVPNRDFVPEEECLMEL